MEETPHSTAEDLQYLQNLVHTSSELMQAGFVLSTLTGSQLNKKKRCSRCSQRCTTRDRRRPTTKAPIQSVISSAESQVQGQAQVQSQDEAPTKAPVYHCKFHPGIVSDKTWTCCGKKPGAAPCISEKSHTPLPYLPGQLAARWHFEPTPLQGRKGTWRDAVAIDCEMGTADDGESELIRVTLVDYFTGSVLVDSLVYPDVRMRHFNTRFSGVTRKDMETARKTRKCIFGVRGARMAVWKFVGPDTIVIGHSVQNDLAALRWIHPKIVDSFLTELSRREALRQDDTNEVKVELETKFEPETKLEPETKPGEAVSRSDTSERGKVSMSLKSLAEIKLGRVIQAKGRAGHDSLEDAIATRDLIRHLVTEMMAMKVGGGEESDVPVVAASTYGDA